MPPSPSTATLSAKKPFLAETVELISTLGMALAIALVLRILLFEPFTIPSESMEPGLQTGDYIVVSKFDYGWSRHSIPLNPPLWRGRILGDGPRRGDVVVFHGTVDPRTSFIKRVIGLPGDHLQFANGVVFVNGEPMRQLDGGWVEDPGAVGLRVKRLIEETPEGRRFVTFDRGPSHAGDDTAEIIVPPAHYLMVGDNRDNSLDSRWSPDDGGLGFIPAENLVGQARFVLLSWRDASIWKPWTWLTIDLSRTLKAIR